MAQEFLENLAAVLPENQGDAHQRAARHDAGSDGIGEFLRLDR